MESLAALERSGWLRIARARGRTNRYEVVVPGDPSTRPTGLSGQPEPSAVSAAVVAVNDTKDPSSGHISTRGDLPSVSERLIRALERRARSSS